MTATVPGGDRELLSGWGRTAPSAATVWRPRTPDEVRRALAEAGSRGVIARGMGRSYGDPAQNAGGAVLDLTGLDQMWLDSTTGMLTAQSGVTIDRILRQSVPHGWFVPVTPGTRFVSVGGAIAADVHGKNHHRDGSFGSHLDSLDLMAGPGGAVRTLQPEGPDSTAFWDTVAGMGATGIITSARVRLLPIETSMILVDTDRFTSLDDLMSAMVEADSRFRYTVAWVDSVAGQGDFRSVLTCGDHAPASALDARQAEDPLAYDPRVRLSVPPVFPARTLNRFSVGAFNSAWFHKAPQHARDELHTIADFFHPLDMVRSWNRVYGRTGFVQYQFAVPDTSAAVIRIALDRLRSAGAPSFLTVLKRFGPANRGPLSFPMPGWTLALDIPASVPGLARTLDDLDDVVLSAGGRHYLAKDARMSPATFAAGYPRLREWRQRVSAAESGIPFTSDLFRRLLP